MNRGYVSKSHTHEARHCTGPHAEIFICRTIISLCYDSVTGNQRAIECAVVFVRGLVGRPAAKMV
jgi:hypothetical protein